MQPLLFSAPASSPAVTSSTSPSCPIAPPRFTMSSSIAPEPWSSNSSSICSCAPSAPSISPALRRYDNLKLGTTLALDKLDFDPHRMNQGTTLALDELHLDPHILSQGTTSVVPKRLKKK